MKPNDRVLQNTTIKVRLYPTAPQAAFFEQTFGCCRWLWNHILADQEKFYAETDVHFLPTPAKYKKEAPFLKEADSSALATVHQNLRKAFQHFFDDPKAYHHPTYKRKKESRESYTVPCQYYAAGKGSNIFLTPNGIRLPKAGEVKAKLYRKPLHWWKLKSATVSRTPTGKYFCSLLFQCPVRPPKPVLPTPETTVGLNLSLAHFYVDSQGHRADLPHWMAQTQDKIRRAQQKLACMEQGSRRYEKQLCRLRKLHEHLANQRKDFLHKESRRLADTWNAVCIKDADLTEMAQRPGLGRVQSLGYGMFRTFLAYKLARQGKACLVVEKYFPSAKTCHHCGAIHDDLPAAARRWTCPSCGTVLDRAQNGAENLRDQGLLQFYQTNGVA